VPAGPHVDVVTGKHAPALEGYAATELKSFLERLYDADVRPGRHRCAPSSDGDRDRDDESVCAMHHESPIQ
jgi:hypothetical protein